MKEFMNGQLINSQVPHFNPMNIDQASRFQGTRKIISLFAVEDT
ncbi:TPA: hypothetical protein ACW9KV_001138 [Legionella pneumophila]